MKVTKNINPPEVFDSLFVASLDHHRASILDTYLVCDVLKASAGLFHQMWLNGSEVEARSRLNLLREHGETVLGWRKGF